MAIKIGFLNGELDMKELHDEKFGTSYTSECADEWLVLIHDIAIGYDGCRSEESLKALIDEMVEYVGNARECMKQGKLYNDDEYEEEDYDPWDDYDWCYECTGYGDDYSYDEDGELVSNCDDCPNNPNRRDPWDD